MGVTEGNDKQPARRPVMAEVEGALTEILVALTAETEARSAETRVFGSADPEDDAGQTRVSFSSERLPRGVGVGGGGGGDTQVYRRGSQSSPSRPPDRGARPGGLPAKRGGLNAADELSSIKRLNLSSPGPRLVD
jgi:hypothetical protein